MGDREKPDLLGPYRQKRSPDRTPEPFGAAEAAALAGGLFVVHKHAARRLHYDLRLEMEGVLRSWAVPKGPSFDTREKRLAVHVEDHPLEYGDFEGMIPEGEYGAGAVIVWDRGEWVPLEDPFEGLRKGKLLFNLNGYKLKGRWTLVKIKKSEKDWLLIKERDGYAKARSGAVSRDVGALRPHYRGPGAGTHPDRPGHGRAGPPGGAGEAGGSRESRADARRAARQRLRQAGLDLRAQA